MTENEPRLRFAPSPTGPLHLGGARTALYNWAAARALGGRFLLRIEDTDRERSEERWLEVILEGLSWLGLDWDEGPGVGGEYGPYFQSRRIAGYNAAAMELLGGGHAYRCYCTSEEIDAGRERLRAAGQRPMYDRRCRDLTEEVRRAYEAEGRIPSLRFKMPLEGSFRVQDLIRGTVEVQLAEFDDFVLVRPDGSPLYNFACVVDDRAMAITHIVRGEEHFLNGVKQHLLYRALAAPAPEFAHIPLILNKEGRKLSKRDADTNMLDYRDKGYPADAVFNYIATLGWGFSGDRDVFTRSEMIERFRIDRVGKAGARFDEEKLQWMCGDYIRRMPVAELVAAAEPFLIAEVVPAAAFKTHRQWIAGVVACYQERIQRYGELPAKVRWLFADVEPDEAAQKALRKHEQAPDWLRAYADRLEGLALPPSYPADRGDADGLATLPTTRETGAPDAGIVPFLLPPHLETDARAFAGEQGIKFGHFVQPVRAALTGTNKGPGLFDVIWLLGKDRTLERLRRAAG